MARFLFPAAFLLAAATVAPLRSAEEQSTPYGVPSVESIKTVLDRILGYLEAETPLRVTDADTGRPVADLTKLPANPALEQTPYGLASYEWGVTYSGMLLTGEVLGDTRYRDYAAPRLATIAAVIARQRARLEAGASGRIPLEGLIRPRDLDHAGSLGAAMIKASREGLSAPELRPCIDTALHWITDGQSRLSDGTLDRANPLPHTLWLDDLYMSVPALAQMGALTGGSRDFDDAVRQVTQFSSRMFVPAKGLYFHGWAEAMDPHPAFCWGRANGWAIMAMAELLSVLPADHPGRPAVLALYRAHARGLAAAQDKSGLWHQLLDRGDSYLETSASAMFVYAIACGVNRGWLNASAYGPMLVLGWNAVAARVNARGQVEGGCIGTGIGWDPAFYCSRPTSVWAAHAYGPVLLAGAEMITLLRGKGAGAYDGTRRVLGVQFPPP